MSNENDPLHVPTAPYDEAAIDRARALLDAAPEMIGPYRVLERIGTGGMGDVFRCIQRQPIRREVAVKSIKLGMDSRAVIARFEAERQALALMDHPHIAKVLDAGTDEAGRPYFVMEYVKGKPLTDYADHTKLTIRERLELFEQVCHAIQHAHHKGIIHRDLKPSNVLVSTEDGKPFAKVIDFGIAKAISQQLTDKTLFTRHDQFIGTPQYMSPEQAAGSIDIDTRTDVYSLGVLLYELLTGTPPFSTADLKAAAFEQFKKLIIEVDPPSPSARLSQSTVTLPTLAAMRGVEPRRLGSIVRGELDWIVMKALEKDRKRRYETPTSLANDLTAYIRGEPVLAAPPSQLYKLRKAVRRHRGVVVTFGVAGTALTVGAIAAGWGWSVATHSAHQERLAKLAVTEALKSEAEQREAAELSLYASHLQQAQLAIETENWPLARRRLADCPSRQRGWEWRFLKSMADSTLLTLPPAQFATFSPDGKELLTVASDHLQLWSLDGQSGKRIPAGPRIEAIEWSTAGDRLMTIGQRDDRTGYRHSPRRGMAWRQDASFPQYRVDVYTRSGDNLVSDASSYGHILPGENPTIPRLSPTGSHFIIVDSNRTARVVSVAANEPTRHLQQHNEMVVSADFTSDGQRIVTGSADGITRLWSIGGTLIAESSKQSDPIEQVTVMAGDSQIVAVAGTRVVFYTMTLTQIDDAIDLYLGRAEAATHGLIRDVIDVHECAGGCLVTAPGCPPVLFSQNGERIDSLALPQGWLADGSASISPNGTRVASRDTTSLSLWEPGSGVVGYLSMPVIQDWHGMYPCRAPGFSPDGSLLLFSPEEVKGSTIDVRARLVSADMLQSPVVKPRSGSLSSLPFPDVAFEASHLSTMQAATACSSSWKWSKDCDGEAECSISCAGRRFRMPKHLSTATVAVPDLTGSRLFVAEGAVLHIIDARSSHELLVVKMPGRIASLQFYGDGERVLVTFSDEDWHLLDPRDYLTKRRDWEWAQQSALAADKLVDTMWASEPSLAEIERKLAPSPDLDEISRFFAQERLRTEIARIDELVQPLFKRVSSNPVRRDMLLGEVLEELGSRDQRFLRERLAHAVKAWEPEAAEYARYAYETISQQAATGPALEDAAEAIRRAAEKERDNAYYTYVHGLAHVRRRRWDEALETLERAELSFPENEIGGQWAEIRAYNGLAIAVSTVHLGDTEAARKQLNATIDFMRDEGIEPEAWFAVLFSDAIKLIAQAPP